MKKLLLFAGLLVLSASCVDESYDLNKISDKVLVIGSDSSSFRVALGTVTISKNDLLRCGMDVEALFQEADIWLPTTLPEGNYVDLSRADTTAYMTKILNSLTAQLLTDDAKMSAITNLIWQKYKDTYIGALQLAETTDEATFKSTFLTSYRNNETARAKLNGIIRDQANKFLVGMRQLGSIEYPIDPIKLSKKVIDMLVDNLDPRGTEPAVNTLCAYGTLENDLPVGLELSSVFEPTTVYLEATADAKQQDGIIKETRIYGDELRQIISGCTLNLHIALNHYYPGQTAVTKRPIRIRIYMIKRGALKINL